MSDTRAFPSRLLASFPRQTIEKLDALGEQTKRNGLHDPMIFFSPADVTGGCEIGPDASRVRAALGFDGDRKRVRALAKVASACALWRRTQGIYIFDRDTADALRATDSSERLPSDLFRRMPSQAVWLQIEGASLSDGDGIFAVLDDTAEGFELLLVLFGRGQHVGSMSLTLDMTCRESVCAAFARADVEDRRPVSDETAESAALMWGSVAFLVMYLCTEEPDIATSASRINARRIGAGKVPLHPTEHRVGFRIGDGFRKAKVDAERSAGLGGDGKPLVPHIRRAHWHAYWVGAHDSPKRRRVVKWLPPIPVNVRSVDDLVPVIRAVGPVAA